MRIAKWGNSLAVGLPAALVPELDLKVGNDIRAVRAHLMQLGHAGPVSETQLGQVRAWIMGCGITKRDQMTEALACLTIGFPGVPDGWPVEVRRLLSDRTRGPGVRVWHLCKQVLGDRG